MDGPRKMESATNGGHGHDAGAAGGAGPGEEVRAEGDGLGAPADLKVILLGDSAVGKSKLVERFMMGDYDPRRMSTYALTTHHMEMTTEDGERLSVEFWDTAGQEQFNTMHPTYYHRAHACVMVFDVTRKATYQHLDEWYRDLRSYCEDIPVILVANKIDVDYKVTKKRFRFPADNGLPFFFASAADGTNVVKVFEECVRQARRHKAAHPTFLDEALSLFPDR